MGLYPNVQPAVPSSSITPSRTERILQPSIVLTTVMLLAGMSIIAVLVAWSIFSSHEPHTSSVGATQVFGLASATSSVAYTFFHALAAIWNDPIGLVRPPQYTLHAICFIVARFALVCWMLTFVTTLAVISQPTACLAGSRSCRLQVADVVASSLGFISAGIILTALEACRYPFQAPSPLYKKAKGDGKFIYLLDHQPVSPNASQTSSMQCDCASQKFADKANGSTIIQKLPEIETLTQSLEVPERPLTPLLPMATQRKQKCWGEEWTHLLKVTPKRKKKKPFSLGSGVSLPSISSSDLSSPSSSSSPSKRSSVSKRTALSRNVTPSSSISSTSRRSPLATMRSAEHPDVAVEPQVAFCPSSTSPPHKFCTTRSAIIFPPSPSLDFHSLQRRNSLTIPQVSQLLTQGLNKSLPPLPRKPVPAPVLHPSTSNAKRQTTEIKVPGAYIDYRPSLEHERNVEEHVRKIETEYVTKTPSKRNQPRISAGRIEKTCALNRVDSKSRYRERRPNVKRVNTTATGGVSESVDDSGEKDETEKEFERVKCLHRLTLGDLSPGLGKVPYLME